MSRCLKMNAPKREEPRIDTKQHESGKDIKAFASIRDFVGPSVVKLDFVIYLFVKRP